MCAPSHRQLEAAGWFDEPTPASLPPGAGLVLPQLRLASDAANPDGLRAGLSKESEGLLLQAIAKFDKAVQSRLRDWLELSEGGPIEASHAAAASPKVKVIACSLDSLFPGICFEQVLLEQLEISRVLDRRRVADVPAPRVFGCNQGAPSIAAAEARLTGEIFPTCSLASCYQRALDLIPTFPKEERAQLLDEVRTWPTKLLTGISIQALSVATNAAFQGIERAVSNEILEFVIAASRHGHHICITSPMSVWAARWLVAERLNPLLTANQESPIPLSCVGGVPSLLYAEGGDLVNEADLAASLSRYTRWNPSAFGPLVFAGDSYACPVTDSRAAAEDSKDIDLAFVGPTESADIYSRTRRMVVLCDVTSYDPKKSDLLTRTNAIPGRSLVVQPLRGSSFLGGSNSLQQ
jgi:hypothetical protein